MMIVPELHGLRQMRPSEAQMFEEWEKSERPYPWSARQFLETLNNSIQQTLVWEENSEVLGFAVLQIIEEEAYLLNIMIQSHFRQLGKGKILMEKLFDWAKSCGSKHVFLDVDPDNHAGLGLYRSVGFKETGRRPRAYPRGEASILMRKDL